MTDKATSMSRDNGAPERIRRQDGGGERDPLPASEANRANQAPSEAEEDVDPNEREPTRSAIANQSSVSPDDYKNSSQSAGSDKVRSGAD